MDASFSFRQRPTDVVDTRAARVGVSDEFPFFVAKWSPYDDR